MRPRITVTLCRDCCCGSPSKHPDTDHDGQRVLLEALASDVIRVQTVECLDECERSNVVHLRDHTAPRTHRDTWLGAVLTTEQTDQLVRWAAGDGGDLPRALQRLRFVHKPPRRVR